MKVAVWNVLSVFDRSTASREENAPKQNRRDSTQPRQERGPRPPPNHSHRRVLASFGRRAICDEQARGGDARLCGYSLSQVRGWRRCAKPQRCKRSPPFATGTKFREEPPFKAAP